MERTRETNSKLCERYPWLKCDESFEWVWILDDLPVGWEDMAMDMIQEIDDELGRCNCRDEFKIIKAKEKWGMMRIYIAQLPDECKVQEILDKYEKMSGHICPICGRYRNPSKWTCGRCR